jgi:hypothetical protein
LSPKKSEENQNVKSLLRRIRLGLMLILAASLLYPFAQRVCAASPDRACDLPQSLQREVAMKYPGASVVNLSDLSDDDKKIFRADQKSFPKIHTNACPGLTKVDFYGDGKPTLAVVLFFPTKKNSQLIVAHEVGTEWNIRPMDTSDGPVPVVWAEPPGKYTDIDNGKVIGAVHPVIVFCGYGGWAIVYAWTGKKVDKVWIMD